MSMVPDLLEALVAADGDAAVLHPGDRPYVAAAAGESDLGPSYAEPARDAMPPAAGQPPRAPEPIAELDAELDDLIDDLPLAPVASWPPDQPARDLPRPSIESAAPSTLSPTELARLDID